MKSLFETLELSVIQEEIKRYCASTLGKNKVDSFAMFDDEEDLKEALDKVDEAMQIINVQGRLPLGGLYDISMILEKANRDGILYGDELLRVASHYQCIKNVKNYIENSDMKLSYLSEMSDGLVYNDYILNEITRCIMPDGSVSDHASDTLYGLRKKIHSIQSQMRVKMESLVKESKDILSIDSMTSRNDRYVLPVKSAYKNQVHGLVHAHSATGATTYIEPEAMVIMNNQLSEIMMLEKEEVERILYSLSQIVKGHYIHCRFNLEILEELDFIFAKGAYGVHNDCCIPVVLKEENNIYIKQARHPLIDIKKVVRNNIYLTDKRMFLISGSNTGGKTVTLKTVGLLSLMALCGMCVPCIEMKIPLFDNIYIDLGDEQSIEQSLSTFSSHMKKIIDILDQSTSRSLVIIDEIGSGTDPQEGESLAQAILQTFLNKDTFVFASTHYGKLKTFAKENEGILMASVSFDLENMKPTYQLKLDSIGASYAIEIASILGLDPSIVAYASQLKLDSMSEHERLMEKLSIKEEQLSLKESQLNDLILENKKLEKKYKHELHQIDKQKEIIVEKAKNDANKLVENAIEEIETIKKSLNNTSLKQHEVIAAKAKLDEMLFVDEVENLKQTHDLQVGDRVHVKKMNREADIIEKLNNHMIVVSLSGLPVKLHEDDVVFIHEKTKIKQPKKASMKKPTVKKTGSYEINLIGKRYEEAMALVDKFLDDALVLGYPHVRIVHGMGTGALRTGVRKILDKNKHIVSYRDGGPNEGGLGATLAYFE